MLKAMFQFSEGDPQDIMLRVSEMSGVRPTIDGGPPYCLTASIFEPFGESRIDDVARIIAGLSGDVVRIPSGPSSNP